VGVTTCFCTAQPWNGSCATKTTNAERTVNRLTAFSARAAAAAKSSTACATSAVHSARTHVWASAQGPTTSCPDTAPFAFTPQWWEL